MSANAKENEGEEKNRGVKLGLRSGKVKFKARVLQKSQS